MKPVKNLLNFTVDSIGMKEKQRNLLNQIIQIQILWENEGIGLHNMLFANNFLKIKNPF